MPDGQDYGWEPQQGYGPQNGQGQPWQAGQYGPGAHQQHMGGPQPPYPPPGVPWQQPAPSTPVQTTPAPSTQARTTEAAQATTPSAPTHTTSAAPPASSAPATCHPLSNAGHCYEPGEYCRTSDHGASGVAGDGEAIKCEDVNGWRWEPV